MIIQHNIISMNAARNYGSVNQIQQKSMEKMSSGYQINRAGDDAASLAISEKMRGQIRGLNQASINVETGISLVQTADGAMQEVNDILNRMRTLGVQAANDTNTDDDREQLQKEVVQLRYEINKIGKDTEFNTIKILQGEGRLIQDVWIPDSEQVKEEIISKYTLVNFDPEDKFNDKTVFLPDKENIINKYNVSNFVTIQCSKTLDFSKITEKNKHLLLNAGFSFGCSQACEQTFSFKFVASIDASNAEQKYKNITTQYGILDTEPNHSINMNSKEGSKKFEIAIDQFNSGKQLVENLTNYIQDMNKIDSKSNSDLFKVGHANYLFATDSGKVILGGDSSYGNTQSPYQGFNYRMFYSDHLEDIIIDNIVEIPGHWAKIYPEKVQLRIQAGSNAGQEINIKLPQIDEQFLGIMDVDVSTHEKAVDSLEMVDSAVEYVNGERTRMGAYQNRMEHTILSIDNTAENLQAAESRIRDLDMASEMVEISKNNILQQAGSAVLSNGTDITQSILQLLP